MPDQMFRDEFLGRSKKIGPLKDGRAVSWRSKRALNKLNERMLPTSLESVIEGEIIPRLLISHRAASSVEPTDDTQTLKEARIEPKTIDRFVEFLLQKREAEAKGLVVALRNCGYEVEEILLDLLAVGARRLGDFWSSDSVDFVSVTLAVSRLQMIMRDLCRPGYQDITVNAAPRTVLLASTPGDQHTFGIFLMEEIFRRDGWNVHTRALESSDELLSVAAGAHYDLIGFSICREELLGQLKNDITAVRAKSLNENVAILAGGSCLQSDPAIAYQIGADGTASDGRGAVDVANRFVA